MGDESIKLSAKTWARTLSSIHKVRYSDGVVDGENKAFQSSFDMGFEEGFQHGFKLGLNAIEQQRSTTTVNQHLVGDEVNCIICADNSKLKDNVMNLYNLQKERNGEALL